MALPRTAQSFAKTSEESRKSTPHSLQSRRWKNAIARDREGNVWLLTQRQHLLRILEARGVEEIPSPTALEAQWRALAADHDGRIWLGGAEGLFKWDEGKFTKVAGPEDQPAGAVAAILPAANGNLWVNWNNEIRVMSAGRWSESLGPWPAKMPPYLQTTGARGRLVLAPPEEGLLVFDADGGKTAIGRELGLSADSAALFVDREENLWASAYRHGIVQVRDKRFSSVVVTKGAHSPSLWTICEGTENSIWLGAEFTLPVLWKSGLETAHRLPVKEDAAWSEVLARDHADAVYSVVQGEGVFTFADGTFRQAMPWPESAGYCYSLYEDRSGRWWLGSNHGLPLLERRRVDGLGQRPGPAPFRDARHRRGRARRALDPAPATAASRGWMAAGSLSSARRKA